MEPRTLSYEIVDSVERIPRLEWDAVFGDIPEGYDFYRTLELSNPPGFSFFYAAIFDRSRVLLIAPLFVSDCPLEAGFHGVAGRLLRRLRKAFPRILSTRTLYCGSPFSEYGVIGVRPGADDPGALVEELLRALDGFSRARNLPCIVFKDFRECDSVLLEPLRRRGFAKVRGLPTVVTDLQSPTFDGYLRALSRSTRKDVRRKVRKALAEARVRVEIADDVAPIADEVHRLYMNTCGAGGARFGRLTKEFFLHAGAQMKPRLLFFLYRADGRLAAFNLCLVHKDLLLDKYIGFDYEISRLHNLYFVSWFCNIEWCLEHGVRRYQTGQNGYGPKLRLGGTLMPLNLYIRHRNPTAGLLYRMAVAGAAGVARRAERR
ncbi:MAG: GNAT family N-acetyltransferase [Chlamydiae bacterium]|nr:GNAT family N-acetyltransferase [Chlamydiota bacterium]